MKMKTKIIILLIITLSFISVTPVWSGNELIVPIATIQIINQNNDHQRRVAQQQRDRQEAERIALEITRQQEAQELIRQRRDRQRQEIANSIRLITERKNELERQRRERLLQNDFLIQEEAIEMFKHEPDPSVKEYFATIILMLGHPNAEATEFLRDTRGWSEVALQNLNIHG